MKDSPEKAGYLKSYFRLSVKLPDHQQLYDKEGGSFVIYLIFFQIVNLLKSDSIAYVSSLFLLIFSIFLVKNSHNIFKKDEEVFN